LRETLAGCRITPHMLQTELHPRLQQRELVEMARAANVGTIMAHCPLAHGSRALLTDGTLARLAAARGDGCTPAQLALRWSIDAGFVPIPKASTRARLEENLRAASIAPLSPAERQAIDALDADDRVSFDPRLIA
jgi:2,5-diketo-D-gluconate reductase A